MKADATPAGFSSSNQIMGVRKTTDFLEKATWGLVIFVVVLSVATVGINKQKPTNSVDSEIKSDYEHAKQAEPGVVTPNFGENPEATKTPSKQALPPKK